MQLIGQKHNLDIISKWSKLPNFLIIQGEEHSGKSFLVLYLCSLFNLHYIKVPNSVKDIRNLINIMSPNSNTVYHLDNFDSASLQAKNALLKVTEEHIAGNYIVITGGPQIRTLQSRATVLNMEPYSFEELQDEYNKNYPTITNYNALFLAGINTPAKLEYYKDCNQIEEILDCCYNIFEHITYLEPIDYIGYLKLFDSRYEKDTIDLCLLFLNMLIKLIENKIITLQRYSYLEILKIIIKYKKQLYQENTLNRKLLLIRMFYQIYELHQQNKIY